MQISTLFGLDQKSYWHIDKLLCTVHPNIEFKWLPHVYFKNHSDICKKKNVYKDLSKTINRQLWQQNDCATCTKFEVSKKLR